MKKFRESELIVNSDGSIYHLKLQAGQVADTVILVGDQGRVETVSRHFDSIEHKVQNREFVTHTGTYKGKPLTVLSTGIGTDNIDIVMNELDALVNIDMQTRQPKPEHRSLNVIRLGTTGALQDGIAVDSFVASAYGLGFDGLLHFYRHEGITEDDMSDAFVQHTSWSDMLPYPYIVKASDVLMERVAGGLRTGITATANGFFGPQGRSLRIPLGFPDLNETIETFRYQGYSITNFEMETSALYGLSRLLGHQALTICTVIANRVSRTYSQDYKTTVEQMIRMVLNRLVS
ncbi:MAG: nucleoside phosphorylase [Bacteroidales bacterium]